MWLRDCRSEQRPHIWRVPKHRHGITFTRSATNTECQALVIPGDPVQRMQLLPGRHLIGSESKPAYIKSTQAQPLLPPRGGPRSMISNISRACWPNRPQYLSTGSDEPPSPNNSAISSTQFYAIHVPTLVCWTATCRTCQNLDLTADSANVAVLPSR